MSSVNHKKLLVTLYLYLLLIGCHQGISIDLGNNIVLLEGDRKEDRIIVFCSSPNSNNCYSGVYIVPSLYSNHMDLKGNYEEYVENAKSNSNWIIVKTKMVSTNINRYWIIDKDFKLNVERCGKELDCAKLLQRQVTGPLSFNLFKNKCQELNIGMKFYE